ncbi:hypothetical protein ALC62_13634 [Cyphomyrmex costatus]|uniref:ISXO2-like transposase domain-containing protein n=1 Tax=Cyphomyrmex costatus TaxID=456900 RepID=A0A151I9K5_9HYME|nr:hypothetical protein ALC62_13634 [Cyphomyrmex costatus]
MHLYEFLNIINDFDLLWNYLCEKKVVRNQIKCPKCDNKLNVRCTENKILHCTSKYYKRYKGRKRQKITCNFKISVFHGTWFENAHIDIQKICRFIAYFLMIQPPRQPFLMNELEMSSSSVVDWINFCRELLQQWVLNKQKVIGGNGRIVELDEAKIGKRKYNKGRIIEGQWVFGGIERNTKNIFILPVPNRSSNTLSSIIQNYVLPGSIIYTDQWRAYRDLENNNNYTHCTVNHSVNFVNPDTGVHTQNIERVWRDMRANIPRYGTREKHYIYCLTEFLFKRIYNFDERIDTFFEIMSTMYPLDDLNVK